VSEERDVGAEVVGWEKQLKSRDMFFLFGGFDGEREMDTGKLEIEVGAEPGNWDFGKGILL
jgi:hypothetical protein